MKGRIHSLESFGTVDGPGVRYVVFFQGCPMRCAYCHNPDTWSTKGGTEMEASYIIEQYERNKGFYANGGGLTVTGGEPLLQIDFLIELFTLAKEKGIVTGTIGAGDTIHGENCMLECIYPVRGSDTLDENNSSTVLQLQFDAFSMLLSGDLGFDGENDLLESQRLKNIDVWKVSHHGSKYSGSEEFLEVIRPQLSLISVGKNTYGHPSKEILIRLENIGSQVETTLDGGALMLESDGNSFVLSLQR